MSRWPLGCAQCCPTSLTTVNVHRGPGFRTPPLGVSHDTGESFATSCAALGIIHHGHACQHHLRCAVSCPAPHRRTVLKRPLTASTTTAASNQTWNRLVTPALPSLPLPLSTSSVAPPCPDVPLKFKPLKFQATHLVELLVHWCA